MVSPFLNMVYRNALGHCSLFYVYEVFVRIEETCKNQILIQYADTVEI